MRSEPGFAGGGPHPRILTPESMKIEAAMKRIAIERYLADKIQWLAERAEARDLVDLDAVLRAHPELAGLLHQRLASLDAVILVERLQAWTETAIRQDLMAYEDADPGAAMQMRDRVLSWLRESTTG